MENREITTVFRNIMLQLEMKGQTTHVGEELMQNRFYCNTREDARDGTDNP